MTQIVSLLDDPQKRTREEAEQAERDARGGRPSKLEPTAETLNTVRGLAGIGATLEEAAGVLGVTKPTFVKFMQTFTAAREAWESGQSNGKVSLRRMQFQAARDGDTTMMIWLGKNWLRQSDKQHLVVSPVLEDDGSPPDVASAAQRYADLAQLPPSLRLIAPPVEIDLEAEDVTEIPGEADMPPPDAE